MLDVFDGILAARLCGEGSSPTPPTPVLIEKTVTANGVYNAEDDNADGYSSVDVEVPASVLTTKTVTANGIYNASSDNADGYSSVAVNVPAIQPQDLTLTGLVRDSWWWDSGNHYLRRANPDAEGDVANRACLKSGHMIIVPKGYSARVTCDKSNMEISAEFANPDGSKDTAASTLNGGWSSQPKPISVPSASDITYFTPLFRLPDNSTIRPDEMPTEVYVHFVADQ